MKGSTSMVSAGDCSIALSKLLVGAQLDTFRVHSLIIYLGFVRAEPSSSLPSEIWVMVSGALDVDDGMAQARGKHFAGEFFERRAAVLGKIYRLLGGRISEVQVNGTGMLEMRTGECRLLAGPAGDGELEEIWAVMSDSPIADARHSWYIALDDTGRFSIQRPT